jgi:hypothetical protein
VIQWLASDPVPVVARPAPTAVTTRTVTSYTVLKAALDAIPNDLDYDAWRNVCFAIHHATNGDDDGLALAHEFSARSPKYDADFLSERVWPYIKSEREQAVTVRTIYSMAAGHGWRDPTIADDFDVIEHGPQPTGRFRALKLSEFTAGLPPAWWVKGVLPQAALTVVFGESGSGKTFFVLDLVASIARGRAWRGRKVKQGRVVYICAEGAGGFRNRVSAYQLENGIDDFDMRVIPESPNFMQTDDIKAVLDSLREVGDVGLVVVDTFAQVMPGANENAGEDVGKAIYHCQQINRQTGAMVVLIHHAGKDSSKGARGWSGLRAAADCEIEINRADNDRSATLTKLKDGEDGAVFGFKLSTVGLGKDDDGEPVTSCVVEHTDSVIKASRGAVTGVVEKPVYQTVRVQLAEGGGGTTLDRVLEVVEVEAANPHVRRSLVRRALRGLDRKGFLIFKDPIIESVEA